MPGILLHLLPASLYAALGIHFWRNRNAPPRPRSEPAHPLGERLWLALALLCHGIALQGELFPDERMRFGFSVAVSMMVWLAVLFYWIETLYTRLDGLQALAMPAAALGALMPLIWPSQHEITNAGSMAFRAHFIVAMLAYSLFTLAALHALLMSLAERQLHSARLTRAFASLPPLLTMEALLFRLIGIAFVLLTLTLLSGIVFSESLFGKAFRFDHKTVFAIISWLLFGALLFGRHAWGWRGRVALRWTLAGFAALMFAYVGSRFVLEVVLHRAA